MVNADWSGDAYAQVSALQKWLAEESLAGLTMGPDESLLDAGCGDGRITAQLARQTTGRVVGFDASPHMISHALVHHRLPNLSFQEALGQSFHSEQPFDRLVSFNALHWIRREELPRALKNLARCVRKGGKAHLRLVGQGPKTSLEAAIEATCALAEWREHFPDFESRFCHPTPEEWKGWTDAAGFHTDSSDLVLKSWDFQEPEAFHRWASTTFVVWTSSLPPERRDDFIRHCLSRYSSPTVFEFYQLVVNLARVAAGGDEARPARDES